MSSLTLDTQLKRHILVVDDNRAIFEDVERILKTVHNTDELDSVEEEIFGADPEESKPKSALPDYQVSYCDQGENAIALIQEEKNGDCPISVAFVDMRMPGGWDGIKTIQEIWKVDPRIQVVICSAYSDTSWEEVQEKFIGQEDKLLILRKPFEPEEIRQLAGSLSQQWNRFVNGKVLYTVEVVGDTMSVVGLTPRKVTKKALIYDKHIRFGDGSHKKVLTAGNPDAPDTPAKALREFVKAQEDRIAIMEENLAVEYRRLTAAQESLLKEMDS